MERPEAPDTFLLFAHQCLQLRQGLTVVEIGLERFRLYFGFLFRSELGAVFVVACSL